MKLIWDECNLLDNMVKVMQTWVSYNQLILSINSTPLHLHTTIITSFINSTPCTQLHLHTTIITSFINSTPCTQLHLHTTIITSFINSTPCTQLHLHTTTITPFIAVLIPFANLTSYGVQEHSAILILYGRGTIKT